MSREYDPRREEGELWYWTITELLVLLIFIFILLGSIYGYNSYFESVSIEIRISLLLLAIGNFLLPILVYLDIQRNMEDPEYLWVHVTAMPVLNIFGAIGYVEARNRLFTEDK